MIPKAQATKVKIDKWDHMKVKKKFFLVVKGTVKGTINKMER